MSSVLRDLRYGARSLRRSPGLTIVATLALALGIGLTTTMFSIIYGALYRGLPFDGADRIVVLWGENPQRHQDRLDLSIHDFRDLERQQRSFERLGAYYSGTVNVSGSERAERFSGSWVTASMFDVAGVRPLLGRSIQASESQPGGEPVAVLGYRLWRDRFAGDPNVVGRTLRANGVPFTIVGVMPEKFEFPDNAALWLPLQLDPLALKRGEGQHLSVVGKLRPGVSIDQANVEAAGIAKRLAAEFKETNDGVTFGIRPFIEGQMGPQPIQLLYTMLGAVVLVLLIACANVANLLLDRAAHRTREVGVRTALGASRGAVVRQYLAEAVVLSLSGTVLGVLAAQGGITVFNRAIVDTDPPFWIDIGLHPMVLLFALGVALVASVAAGLLPAWQASRTDIAEILKDESRGASSFRIGRLSRALVVFEIALSCALLAAAGLMVKSVAKLRNMDVGFPTANLFTARVGFPATYTDTAKQAAFWVTLQQRLAALPGVTSATVASGLPGVSMGGSSVAIEGVAYATEHDYPRTRTQSVQPTYFATLQLPIRRGRGFTDGDRQGSLPVAVVSEPFVAKYFPGVDPIGRRIRLGGAKSTAPWTTIVGVAPQVFTGDNEQPFEPVVFTPLAQVHSNFASIAIRTSGPPMAVTSSVRDAAAALDADIPIYWVYSMKDALARNMWFVRVFGTMFVIFGAIALFLAAVGLYAVMAFSVGRRTREVGIRIALGAQGSHVMQLILRQGLAQLGVGLGIGLAFAFGVSQLMSLLLYQVQPHDPAVFASVIGVLAAAGLLACYVPARRALAVDPLVAMRAE